LSLFLIDAGTEWREGLNQVLFVGRELRAKGYPSFLLAPAGSPLSKRAEAAGLAALPLKDTDGPGFMARLRLARLMRNRGCVLVHFLDLRAAGLFSRVADRADVRVRVLSGRPDVAGRASGLDPRSIDAAVAPSAGARDALVRAGFAEAAVHIIPPGVDFAPFREAAGGESFRRELGFEPDDFVVGVSANLEDERSFRVLAETAGIVRAQAPKFRLLVLGHGTLRLEPGGHVAPAEDAFRYYLGHREDGPRALASLDVFVMFSQLQALDGLLMEAMASRVPVVAAETGVDQGLVADRKTGLLVPLWDAAALAEALLKVHRDKELAARLSEQGYETVHRGYSAEAMAGRIVKIYERLASRKGVKLG
jgi:glycosyltransferase involved in cell wall biosynthesis